jgi:hypothetical protein
MEPLSPEGERIVGYFVMSNTHTLFGCVRIITSWGKKTQQVLDSAHNDAVGHYGLCRIER